MLLANDCVETYRITKCLIGMNRFENVSQNGSHKKFPKNFVRIEKEKFQQKPIKKKKKTLHLRS